MKLSPLLLKCPFAEVNLLMQLRALKLDQILLHKSVFVGIDKFRQQFVLLMSLIAPWPFFLIAEYIWRRHSLNLKGYRPEMEIIQKKLVTLIPNSETALKLNVTLA